MTKKSRDRRKINRLQKSKRHEEAIAILDEHKVKILRNIKAFNGSNEMH